MQKGNFVWIIIKIQKSVIYLFIFYQFFLSSEQQKHTHTGWQADTQIQILHAHKQRGCISQSKRWRADWSPGENGRYSPNIDINKAS